MALPLPVYDKISSLNPSKDSWNLRVRIIRLWPTYKFRSPKPTSLEMVLVDEDSEKIHASVRKSLIYKFERLLKEGEAYTLSLFSLGEASGSYLTTRHPYHINFQFDTDINVLQQSNIPNNAFSFSSVTELLSMDDKNPYLVDVIGLLTGHGMERQIMTDGKSTKMNVIEIDIDGSRFECALFGHYVDQLNRFLQSPGNHDGTVLVIQFARVKIFKKKVCLQNSLTCSRFYWDCKLPVAMEYRKRVSGDSVALSQPLSQIQAVREISVRDDFILYTERKTIEKMKDCKDDCFCIVYGTITHLLGGENWWYKGCKCGRAVTSEPRNGVVNDEVIYYCASCDTHVDTVVPRYRLRIKVVDNSDSASFVIFDREAASLFNKSCASMVESIGLAPEVPSMPQELVSLVDKSYLFKVEIKPSGNPTFQSSFIVKKIVEDKDIIDEFMSKASPVKETNFDIVTLSDVKDNTFMDINKSLAPKDLLKDFEASSTSASFKNESDFVVDKADEDGLVNKKQKIEEMGSPE